MANEFAGMTFEEAVDLVAKETGDVIEAAFDGQINMKDFMELIEGGKAWNAALKIPSITRKQLIAHVFARLPKYGVAVWEPLPEGVIPATE